MAPNRRILVERMLLDIPPEARPANRPVYGYCTGSSEAHQNVIKYGDAVLELKRHVNHRTTFTFGDSLDEAAFIPARPPFCPSPLSFPKLYAVIAIAIGVGPGAMTRLERRDGHLWAQLPKRGLWLWGGLIVSRLVISGIGDATGAHLAAGTTAIVLMLGLNRAAQALVVAPRAIAAGIRFAPEKDGSVFRAGWFTHADGRQG